MIHRGFNWSWF